MSSARLPVPFDDLGEQVGRDEALPKPDAVGNEDAIVFLQDALRPEHPVGLKAL